MKPIYIDDVFADVTLNEIFTTTPWIKVREARLECFMSRGTETYTYGSGESAKAYTPVAYSTLVSNIQDDLNNGKSEWVSGPLEVDKPNSYNVCFLNRYDNAKMMLGWHSDDSPGMNHGHPIAIVSFGQEREIWWRLKEQTGVIPKDQRQLLKHGSLFIMPAGFQLTHQHRIPKGDREMGCRVSLTFRNYQPV